MSYKDWFGVPKGVNGAPPTSTQKMQYGMGVGMGTLALAGSVAGSLESNAPELNAMKAQEASGGSKAELFKQIGAYDPVSLGRDNVAMKGLSGAAAGAAAGSVVPGIGTAIGAVVGGAAGAIGAAFRNKNSASTERRLAQEQAANFASENARLTQQGISNALINYAALGGQFGMNPQPTTEINAGGTHESNPNSGVNFGIGQNGRVNKVEQGEVVHNNFVYSDRIPIHKDYVEGFGLPNKLVDKTYAKGAKLISKESKERPYDPISNLTKNTMLSRLEEAQETFKGEQMFDKVNKANPENANMFDWGGRFSNLGEWWDSFQKQSADELKIRPPAKFTQVNIPSELEYPTQPDVKKAGTISDYTPNYLTGQQTNPLLNSNIKTFTPLRASQGISNYSQEPIVPTKSKGVGSGGARSKAAPAETLAAKEAANILPDAPLGADTPQFMMEEERRNQLNRRPMDESSGANWSDLGLLAPAMGNLATMLSAVGSKPEQVSIPRMAAAPRLNEIMPYNPMDTNYLTSQLKGQAGATRRSIMDAAGGNRGAALGALAATDQNYLGALADTYMKANEYNRAQQVQNRQFQNQARQANSAMFLQEQAANQGAYMQEWQVNAANRAARRSAIQQGIQALSGNVGETSRYLKNLRTIRNTYMYDSEGNPTN